MSMNKKILVIGLLLLFSCFVFASSTNTIQNFALSWNPNTNQLSINSQCKSQAIAELVLSTGQSKTIICPTFDVGSTWLLGEMTASNITGTLTIVEPCELCSKSTTINLSNPSNQSGWLSPQLLFGGLMIILILGFLFVVNLLKR